MPRTNKPSCQIVFPIVIVLFFIVAVISLLTVRYYDGIKPLTELNCLDQSLIDDPLLLRSHFRHDFLLISKINDIVSRSYDISTSHPLLAGEHKEPPIRFFGQKQYTAEEITPTIVLRVAALNYSSYPKLSMEDAVLEAALKRVMNGGCIFLVPEGL